MDTWLFAIVIIICTEEERLEDGKLKHAPSLHQTDSQGETTFGQTRPLSTDGERG